MDKLDIMLNKALEIIKENPDAVFEEIKQIHKELGENNSITIEEYLDNFPFVYETMFNHSTAEFYIDTIKMEEKPFFGEIKFIKNLEEGNFTPILSAA